MYIDDHIIILPLYKPKFKLISLTIFSKSEDGIISVFVITRFSELHYNVGVILTQFILAVGAQAADVII